MPSVRGFLLDKVVDLLIVVPLGGSILALYSYVLGAVPWQVMAGVGGTGRFGSSRGGVRQV
jgi:hypothetical protein